MRVSQLSPADIFGRLAGPGLYLETGPFVVHIHSDVRLLARGLGLLYADFPLAESTDFADLHVSLARPYSIRRWIRPQINFYVDRQTSTYPLPLDQALAMFEWNLNWALYQYAQSYLVTHAASVERGGFAAIMPGEPGAGKSTLCAGLIHRGWRLLTDEMTLLSRAGGEIVPLARPVTLKNKSIELIGKFAPRARFGPHCLDTVKGAIAHLRPPTESVLRVNETARPRWLIFPRYQPASSIEVKTLSKTKAFMQLMSAILNYPFDGVRDFELMCGVVDQVDCFQLTYSLLDEAIAWFDELAGQEMR